MQGPQGLQWQENVQSQIFLQNDTGNYHYRTGRFKSQSTILRCKAQSSTLLGGGGAGGRGVARRVWANLLSSVSLSRPLYLPCKQGDAQSGCGPVTCL